MNTSTNDFTYNNIAKNCKGHVHLRGLWAIDLCKGCSFWCVITRNWKQILTFYFFCCVDKHPKSITGCKNLRFNTRWLCYSVWGKTFHNSGFNSETILPISIFLFDNDTYMPSPQNGIRVCQLELYFWKYFIFCIKHMWSIEKPGNRF